MFPIQQWEDDPAESEAGIGVACSFVVWFEAAGDYTASLDPTQREGDQREVE